jgi:hypothetical protein
LRFYHEQRLLIPTSVNEETGYRYNDRSKIESARRITHLPFHIEEKVTDPIVVAGIRTKGRYADCGPAFARIGRSLGRYINGKPLMLHYDSEFYEIQVPTREIYHKGPGMIFRGNPKNYLTEIQMLIDGDEKKLY